MQRGASGKLEVTTTAGEAVRSFVQEPLPPIPPLVIERQRQRRIEAALLACGRLDGISAMLPDPDLFLYAYVRREAVLSSQIEGTQSSLSDLLLFELDDAPGGPLNDVVDVSNYVAALENGLARLRGGFPLSNRLIREVHERLLTRGRGADKQPGEFRRSQNWIGGTRPTNALFVPPPPHLVETCMGQLEAFLHAKEDGLPTLVRAALAHVQFETIHPFLDGNGRVERLLIALMLFESKVLQQPLLYLSLYFKQHRDEYYRLLSLVRTSGDWEAWLDFPGRRHTDCRTSCRDGPSPPCVVPRRCPADSVPGACCGECVARVRCLAGSAAEQHRRSGRSHGCGLPDGCPRCGVAGTHGHRARGHRAQARARVRLFALSRHPQ